MYCHPAMVLRSCHSDVVMYSHVVALLFRLYSFVPPETGQMHSKCCETDILAQGVHLDSLRMDSPYTARCDNWWIYTDGVQHTGAGECDWGDGFDELPLEFSRSFGRTGPILWCDRLRRSRRMRPGWTSSKVEMLKEFTKKSSNIRLKPNIILYLGDILDHLLQIHQQIGIHNESFERSHANYLVQINLELSHASNRLNWVIRKMTVFTIGIMPLNLIASRWRIYHWFW